MDSKGSGLLRDFKLILFKRLISSVMPNTKEKRINGFLKISYFSIS